MPRPAQRRVARKIGTGRTPLVLRCLLPLTVATGIGCGRPDFVWPLPSTQTSFKDPLPANQVSLDSLKGERGADKGCVFRYYSLRYGWRAHLIEYDRDRCTAVVQFRSLSSDFARASGIDSAAAGTATSGPIPGDGISAFLQFEYKEVKDLDLHFLTLVVTVLVFSLTFSEKIVNFQVASRRTRAFLLWSWGAFVVAIIGAGLALTLVFIAGITATNSERFVSLNGTDAYWWWRNRSGWALLISGCLFVAGLVLLLSSGIATLRRAAKET